MGPVLFSAGYQRSASADAFAAHLAEHGVQLAIDVRRRPVSQRPGYDAAGLGAACAAAGLRYVSAPALGNPPSLADLWDRDPESAQRRLRAHLETDVTRHVDRLVELVPTTRVCLVCMCPRVERCHRGVLIDLLCERLGGRHVSLSPGV